MARNNIHDALRLAQQGWKLIPLHTVEDGVCDCGRKPCAKPAKHPRITEWETRGSDALADIADWWGSRWPHANIGVVCGLSGLVVLDIDPRNGGDDALAALIEEHGALPAGPKVITGSGGFHLYFRHPAGPGLRKGRDAGYIGNRAGMRPGVDVRADGGQVVAPPSVYVTGVMYRWEEGRAAETALPEMPEWLLALVRGHGGQEPGVRPSYELPERIPVGQRHAEYVRWAGYMRGKGASEAMIYASLLALNSERADEQMDEKEVAQVAADAAQRWPVTESFVYQGSRPEPYEQGQAVMRALAPYRASELRLVELPEPRWAAQPLFPEGLTIVAGPIKIGKAQPLDARVLTPGGWRLMGSLVVGDEVIGSNGRPVRVQAVHPQGIQDIYTVTFSDGSSTRATAEHRWVVSVKPTTREYLTDTLIMQRAVSEGETRYVRLMDAPARFSDAPAPPLDPYALGLLLGDGGLTKGVTFTPGDESLFAALMDALPDTVEATRSPDGRSVTVRGQRFRQNPLLDQLRVWGLVGRKSVDKFIPPEYLVAPADARFALVQGLMDTDGGVECGSAVYATSSPRLAADVREVVESLGGTARTRIKTDPAYWYKGERRTGQPAFSIRIRIPSYGCPFRLERKAQAWRTGRTFRKPPRRRVVSVVQEQAPAAARCITVDAPDGLYVTDHCIVTHNSWLALDLAVEIAQGGVVFGEVPVADGDVLYLALEDSRRRMKGRLEVRMGDEVWPDRLEIVDMENRWPRADEGGVQALDSWLGQHPQARLVIIDTLQKFRAQPKGNGNAYAEDYNAMTPMHDLANRHHICLILVHHYNKALHDDWVDKVSGTTGIGGAADTLVALTRPRGREGQQDTRLRITGRDVEEQDYKLTFNAFRWKIEGEYGEREASSTAPAMQKLLAFMGQRPWAEYTAGVVQEGLEQPTVDAARKLLNRAEALGLIIRHGRGTWRLAPGTEREFGTEEERNATVISDEDGVFSKTQFEHNVSFTPFQNAGAIIGETDMHFGHEPDIGHPEGENAAVSSLPREAEERVSDSKIGDGRPIGGYHDTSVRGGMSECPFVSEPVSALASEAQSPFGHSDIGHSDTTGQQTGREAFSSTAQGQGITGGPGVPERLMGKRCSGCQGLEPWVWTGHGWVCGVCRPHVRAVGEVT